MLERKLENFNDKMQAPVVRLLLSSLVRFDLVNLPRERYLLAFDITDGHVHSLNMVDETSALPGNTHKIVDLEEADKETMHLLVFLLMQFLSRQDQVNENFSVINSIENLYFQQIFKQYKHRLIRRTRNLCRRLKESCCDISTSY